MAPKPETAEAIVLNFVNEQNRPLNVQNVADALQKFAVKKTAAQKALDSLADSGQISFKEYGKQKIYLARQDQFEIPNNEEIEELKKENERLQKELESENAAKNALEAELRVMGSNLTLEQIKEKDKKLNEEIIQMETKLSKLRGGTVLVTPEERQKIQQLFSTRISQWRKRKRIFKDLWAIITETMPNDLKEFKEELGIELDEDVGVNLEDYSNLGTKKQRC